MTAENTTQDLARSYSRLLTTKRTILAVLPDMISAARNPEVRQALVAYREIDRNHMVLMMGAAPPYVRLCEADVPDRLGAARRDCDALLADDSPCTNRDGCLLGIARDMKGAEVDLSAQARYGKSGPDGAATATDLLLHQIATEDAEAHRHLCALAERPDFSASNASPSPAD